MEYKSGVYKIVNIITNDFYIGSSSVSILSRWSRHKNELKDNRHPNKYLQNIYNKYGLENLNFEIIERCISTDCIIKEQFWINTLNPKYNILKIAGSSLGYKHSIETIAKLTNKKASLVTKEKQRNAKLGRVDSKRKVVLQYDLQGNFIKEYNSITEVSKLNNYKGEGNISNCCNNKLKSAYGYIWRFK